MFQVFYSSWNETFIFKQRSIETNRNKYDYKGVCLELWITKIRIIYYYYLKKKKPESELAEKAIQKQIDFKITPDTLTNVKDVINS